MDKIYIDGQAFIPEKDILLCNVEETDILKPFGNVLEYERLYVTKKGSFYKIKMTAKKKEVHMVSKENAAAFMYENAAYIITDNYDLIFGEPERG